MGNDHSHCAHNHNKHGSALFWAIVVNILLTVVQVVGGVLSGSISLIADALHNFSDAGALIIAYFAQKISGKPADEEMTFGYGRAEILGALINSVTLVLVGGYLLIEAGKRFLHPEPIDGWMVIVVASIALVVDLFTAWLTYKGAKDSINMRAAFIHNLSDAMASVVVIISGTLILLFNVYWVDFVATAIIAIYVVWHSWGLIRSCIKTLMQAVPEDINSAEVIKALSSVEGVLSVHHLHIWAIHEKTRSLEGHVQVETDSLLEVEAMKKELRSILRERFKINHSTLEFENVKADCSAKDH
ncbi:MAG: cation diffusion facilitator family transporter [Bdellovibrionales bacterium]